MNTAKIPVNGNIVLSAKNRLDT